MTNKREMLDDLVVRINEEVEIVSSRIIDGEADEYSGYLLSWGYNDVDARQAVEESRLPDEIKDSILKQKDIKTYVEPYLYVNVIGIRTHDEELISLTVGEVEHQLSDDLTALWETLNHEEKTYVSRRVEAYFPDDGNGQFIYINHDYDRYVLLFDVEKYLAENDPKDDDNGPNDEGPGPGDDQAKNLSSSLSQILNFSRELRALQSPFIEADRRRQLDGPELRCIDGAGLEAVDLMHWRINKRLISKRSLAKLKLVG